VGLETLLLMSAVGTTVGGTVVQMRGAKEQADAAVATARYEAQVFRSEQEAIRIMSAEEQKLMREDLRQTLKRQRALVAKSGTTMRGSPLQIQLRTIEDRAYDIGMLAHTRDVEARRFGQKATLSMMESKFARKTGKLQIRQVLWGGASRLGMMGMQYVVS